MKKGITYYLGYTVGIIFFLLSIAILLFFAYWALGAIFSVLWGVALTPLGIAPISPLQGSAMVLMGHILFPSIRLSKKPSKSLESDKISQLFNSNTKGRA